ncbi:MAG: Hsp20/alpha crystallin family protein [Bdellovibrionales bacterium]|nr:Hsp20/alpha crystallin family protein [Bdellovibrionales bacterium]
MKKRNAFFSIVGAATMLALSGTAEAAKTTSPATSGSDAFFNGYFDEPFFKRNTDPFGEMAHVRNSLLEEMKVAQKDAKAFDQWFEKKYGGRVENIRQREDKGHYYYDVAVNDLKDTKVGTSIKNGEITITGYIDKKTKAGEETTSFTRMFPAPRNIDPNHVEIDQGKDKITIKFEKRVPEV